MAIAEYKVLTSAITVRLSKDDKKVARVLRGRIVSLDDEVVDVARLLHLKAIGVKGAKGLRPTTAKVLAAQAGAEDDPVKAPDPAAAGVSPVGEGLEAPTA